jgi:RNA polymerase sigma-70 factor (ECF subfamily)
MKLQMNPNQFISANKNLSLLYEKLKQIFMKFASKNFSIDREAMEDIYQETFIALYENMQNGTCPPAVSCQTYMLAIAKHKLLNYLRDNHLDLSNIPEEKIHENRFYESEDWIQKQEIVYREVCKMQEPCNRILSLFYYDRKSMEEIAEMFNYKNEQVAKNRKYLCIKKLKEIIITRLKEEDLI